MFVVVYAWDGAVEGVEDAAFLLVAQWRPSARCGCDCCGCLEAQLGCGRDGADRRIGGGVMVVCVVGARGV